MPRICVWTAPATPKVHRSELEVLMVGEMADAGGDFRVVSVLPFVVMVLSVISALPLGRYLAESQDEQGKA